MRQRSAAPTSIQEQQRLFFERLGRAVGNWQLVEMQLFRVYARLARCENADVASAAFHAIVGFRVRLDITDAAAQTALTGQTLAAWDALYRRTRRLSKRRNLLAHFVVVYGINKPTLPEHGPFLQPSVFDVTRRPKPTDKPIDASRIKAMGDSFTRLSNTFSSFADKLPAPVSSLGRSI
jgi:hypothetical protein